MHDSINRWLSTLVQLLLLVNALPAGIWDPLKCVAGV